MAVTTAKVQVTGLARKLVMDGLLTEEAAATAWEEAISSKVPFVSHVVSNHLVSATAVAQVAAD
jgi:type IV pilus assembly protein PilB